MLKIIPKMPQIHPQKDNFWGRFSSLHNLQKLLKNFKLSRHPIQQSRHRRSLKNHEHNRSAPTRVHTKAQIRLHSEVERHSNNALLSSWQAHRRRPFANSLEPQGWNSFTPRSISNRRRKFDTWEHRSGWQGSLRLFSGEWSGKNWMRVGAYDRDTPTESTLESHSKQHKRFNHSAMDAKLCSIQHEIFNLVSRDGWRFVEGSRSANK